MSIILSKLLIKKQHPDGVEDETVISKDGLTVTQKKVCKCPAYPWPHRWLGGSCRYPDSPLRPYTRKAGKHRAGWKRPPKNRLKVVNGVIVLATGCYAKRIPKSLAKELGIHHLVRKPRQKKAGKACQTQKR